MSYKQLQAIANGDDYLKDHSYARYESPALQQLKARAVLSVLDEQLEDEGLVDVFETEPTPKTNEWLDKYATRMVLQFNADSRFEESITLAVGIPDSVLATIR